MLGFEQVKDRLGCDDASCLAEIGGALGVDFIVAGNVAQLGDVYLLNLRLIAPKHAKVIKGVSSKVTGGEAGFLDVIPTSVGELFGTAVGGGMLERRSSPTQVSVDRQLLDMEWKKTREVVFADEDDADVERKLGTMKSFVSQFPQQNPYMARALEYQEELEEGFDPAYPYDDTQYTLYLTGGLMLGLGWFLYSLPAYIIAVTSEAEYKRTNGASNIDPPEWVEPVTWIPIAGPMAVSANFDEIEDIWKALGFGDGVIQAVGLILLLVTPFLNEKIEDPDAAKPTAGPAAAWLLNNLQVRPIASEQMRGMAIVARW